MRAAGGPPRPVANGRFARWAVEMSRMVAAIRRAAVQRPFNSSHSEGEGE